MGRVVVWFPRAVALVALVALAVSLADLARWTRDQPPSPWVHRELCASLSLALLAAGLGARSGVAAFARVVRWTRAGAAATLDRDCALLVALGLAAAAGVAVHVGRPPDATVERLWQPGVLSSLLPLAAFVFARALATAWLLAGAPGADARRGDGPGKAAPDQEGPGLRAHPARGAHEGADRSLAPGEASRGRRLLQAAAGAALGLACGFGAPAALERLEALTAVPYRQAEPSVFWRATGRTFVERHEVRGAIVGPVATLRVRKVYVNHAQQPQDGVEVREVVNTPPCAAFHDFWITEAGVRLDAKVRARADARQEYDRTKRRRRDPGLLEYQGEGNWELAVYPVTPDGVGKDAAYVLDQLLEVDADGWCTLRLAMGALPIQAFDLELALHEPRGVLEFELPRPLRAEAAGDDRYVLRGTMVRVAEDPADLRLRWRVDPLSLRCREAGRREVRRLRCRAPDSGLPVGELLGMAGVPLGATLGAVTLLARRLPGEAPGTLLGWLDLAGAQPEPVLLDGAPPVELPVDEATFARLEAAAATARLLHAPGTAEARREMARLALQHRVPGPLTSLYAAPGDREDDPLDLIAAGELPEDRVALHRLDQGPERSEEVARQAPPRPARGGLQVAPGLMAPSFRRARERANDRACFANQKTVAGALEMYHLDTDIDLAQSPAGPGPATAPTSAPLVLVDPFRAAPGLVAEAAHWRVDVRAGRGERVRSLEPAFDVLLAKGYLQSRPQDPGAGVDSSSNYVVVGSTLLCLEHGALDPPEGLRPGAPAREQLLALGVLEPELLSRASGVERRGQGEAPVAPPLVVELEVLPFALLAPLLWPLGRWRPAWRAFLAAAAGFLPAVLYGASRNETMHAAFAVHLTLAPLGLWALLGVVGTAASFVRGRLPEGLRRDAAFDDGLLAVEVRRQRSLRRLTGWLLIGAVAATVGGALWVPWRRRFALGPLTGADGAYLGAALLALFLLGVASGLGRCCTVAARGRGPGRRGSGLEWAVTRVLWALAGAWLTMGVFKAAGDPWGAQQLAFLGLQGALAAAFLHGRARAAAACLDELEPGRGPRAEISLERARCPVCGDGFGPGEEPARCERCGTPHHRACLEFAGACAVFGCARP